VPEPDFNEAAAIIEILGPLCFHTAARPHQQARSSLSECALMLRVNRRLNQEGRGRQVRAAKRGQENQLGVYFLVGGDKVLETDLDLEEFARSVGALKSLGETLGD
jgi:hypothetical protein